MSNPFEQDFQSENAGCTKAFLVFAGLIFATGVVLWINCSSGYAISRIEALGGSVSHETWMTTVYTHLSLDDTTATDSDLEYVRRLDPQGSVSLRNTHITDQGLKYLAGLSCMDIDLRCTSITVAGLSNLKNSMRSNTQILSDFD